MVTNLCYKSSYLRLVQTHLHKHICTFLYFSSCYKFDCSRHYLLYRMGVLKRNNNSLQMTITPSWYTFAGLCIDMLLHIYIHPAYLCYKSFYSLLAQIQLCKSMYTIYHLSCYKFGCIHPYFVDHRDVLKLKT